MTKNQKLNKLKKDIVAENPCPELTSGAIQMVFGDGNVDAKIVFVGEAPGKKEDETGKPFVGASGKFLNEMLEMNHMNREDVYITNIVKYRPPENRDPTNEEKTEFWHYLVEQINIIKPKIIATLGHHSGQAFIKSLRIGADHGKPHTVELQTNLEDKFTVTVVPLYHPAAALYNGALRQTLLDDFTIVKKLLTN